MCEKKVWLKRKEKGDEFMRDVFLHCFFVLSFLFPNFMSAQEKLEDKYLVSFGDSEAEVTVTEYFSLSCAHCIHLFNRDFQKIKEDYIETGILRWDFHVVPLTEVDVWAMICMENLNESEKRVFLESTLAEFENVNKEMACALMKKAMEFFKTPIPQIGQSDYLSQSDAFKKAFVFIQQNEVESLPSIEIDGELFAEIPGENLIDRKIKGTFL